MAWGGVRGEGGGGGSLVSSHLLAQIQQLPSLPALDAPHHGLPSISSPQASVAFGRLHSHASLHALIARTPQTVERRNSRHATVTLRRSREDRIGLRAPELTLSVLRVGGAGYTTVAVVNSSDSGCFDC